MPETTLTVTTEEVTLFELLGFKLAEKISRMRSNNQPSFCIKNVGAETLLVKSILQEIKGYPIEAGEQIALTKAGLSNIRLSTETGETEIRLLSV